MNSEQLQKKLQLTITLSRRKAMYSNFCLFFHATCNDKLFIFGTGMSDFF